MPLQVHGELTGRESGLSITQMTATHNRAANGTLISALMVKILFMEHYCEFTIISLNTLQVCNSTRPGQEHNLRHTSRWLRRTPEAYRASRQRAVLALGTDPLWQGGQLQCTHMLSSARLGHENPLQVAAGSSLLPVVSGPFVAASFLLWPHLCDRVAKKREGETKELDKLQNLEFTAGPSCLALAE